MLIGWWSLVCLMMGTRAPAVELSNEAPGTHRDVPPSTQFEESRLRKEAAEHERVAVEEVDSSLLHGHLGLRTLMT